MTSEMFMNKIALPPVAYLMLQKFVHGEHDNLKNLLLAAYQPFAGKPVLELGCGTGMLSQFFEPGLYTGVDIDEARIKAGKVSYPNAKLVHADIRMLAPDFFAPYEFMFCHAWLHHIDNENCKAIFHAIQKASGHSQKLLMVYEPVLPRFVKNPIGYLLGKFDRGDFVRPQAQLEQLCQPFLRNSRHHPPKWRWPIPGAELSLVFGAA